MKNDTVVSKFLPVQDVIITEGNRVSVGYETDTKLSARQWRAYPDHDHGMPTREERERAMLNRSRPQANEQALSDELMRQVSGKPRTESPPPPQAKFSESPVVESPERKLERELWAQRFHQGEAVNRLETELFRQVAEGGKHVQEGPKTAILGV